MKTLIQHGVENGYFYTHFFKERLHSITCFLDHNVFRSSKFKLLKTELCVLCSWKEFNCHKPTERL